MAATGQQIEFIEYLDKSTGDRLHRRSIKAERIGTAFPVWKVHMVREATVIVQHADFGPDFASEDFAT